VKQLTETQIKRLIVMGESPILRLVSITEEVLKDTHLSPRYRIIDGALHRKSFLCDDLWVPFLTHKSTADALALFKVYLVKEP